MDRIILHVTYSGDNAKAFIEEMQQSGLQKKVQNEDGCLQYDYYAAVDGSGNMFLVEGWRDTDAIKAHTNGQTMKTVRAIKEKLGIITTMEKFE